MMPHPSLSRRTLLGTLALPALAPAKGKLRAGCQTRAYGSPIRDKQKLLAVLDDLAEAGYEGFETNFASLEHSFDNPKPMAGEIAARGLELIGLHASPRFETEAGMAQARRIAQAIADLGASHFICSPSGEIDAETYDRFGAFCQSLGVRFAIHNHRKELDNDGLILRAALAHTNPSYVSALFDLSYFSDANLSAPEWIARYHSRLAGVHVRDHRDGTEVLLGEGKLEARAIGKALQRTNWSGWVILEMNARPDMPSREIITRGRAFLKDPMGVL